MNRPAPHGTPARPRLSVVIPVLDEADNLVPLAEELRAALRDAGSYEVIFVDDGSRDESLPTLAKLAAEDHRIRVLRMGANLGQSAALMAGLHAGRGALLATMDGDGQNDPADLPALLAAVRNADLAIGIRVDREDDWRRRWSSRIANLARRAVLGDSCEDIGCALKVFGAEWLGAIAGFDGVHRFLPALLEANGARVIQLPVRHRPRVAGRSKYGIGNRLGRGLLDLVGVRWLISRRLRTERAIGRASGPPHGEMGIDSLPKQEALGIRLGAGPHGKTRPGLVATPALSRR